MRTVCVGVGQHVLVAWCWRVEQEVDVVLTLFWIGTARGFWVLHVGDLNSAKICSSLFCVAVGCFCPSCSYQLYREQFVLCRVASASTSVFTVKCTELLSGDKHPVKRWLQEGSVAHSL